MDTLAAFGKIRGASDFLAWFGGLPSFHDAEIMDLILDRSGPSRLRIHTWKMTGALDSEGQFVIDKHVVVSFHLTGILALDLSDFNHQNVIYGLDAVQHEDGIELRLEHCWGMSGSLKAQDIALDYLPGRPAKTSHG